MGARLLVVWDQDLRLIVVLTLVLYVLKEKVFIRLLQRSIFVSIPLLHGVGFGIGIGMERQRALGIICFGVGLLLSFDTTVIGDGVLYYLRENWRLGWANRKRYVRENRCWDGRKIKRRRYGGLGLRATNMVM